MKIVMNLSLTMSSYTQMAVPAAVSEMMSVNIEVSDRFLTW